MRNRGRSSSRTTPTSNGHSPPTTGGVLPLNHFTHQAPVLVTIVMERAKAASQLGSWIKGKHFPLMDIGIAAEHFCLQAAEEGLGTCMLGWFDEARVRELLGIPAPSRPALILTVGYPAGEAASPRQRKRLEEMSLWNRPLIEVSPVPSTRAWRGLAGWLAVTYAGAAIGGAATASARSFYATLVQPVWAPPAWVFGPVWSLLYTLMAVAAWLVWRRGGFRAARGALRLYLVQLAANALWSWLFFAGRLGAVAFAEILLLLALVTATVRAFARHRRLAAALLLPYLAWCAFAAALAFAVWRMNPGRL